MSPVTVQVDASLIVGEDQDDIRPLRLGRGNGAAADG